MALTYARLVSPFYLSAAFMGELYGLGVVLGIAAALTDLEGYLARWWNCETERGAVLDVIADKVYAWTMAGIGWALCDFRPEFIAPLALILGYDGYISALRYLGRVSASCFAGKVKTFLLFPALIAMTWTSVAWLPRFPVEQAALTLLVAASAFACWSMLCQLGITRDCPDPRPALARAARMLRIRI